MGFFFRFLHFGLCPLVRGDLAHLSIFRFLNIFRLAEA